MTGDDYDTCYPLLSRLVSNLVITAFYWEESTGTTNVGTTNVFYHINPNTIAEVALADGQVSEGTGTTS